jgi:hypothetical protein
MANHHPDREGMPKWVLDLGNQFFHKAVTIVQRMKPTEENITKIHNLIMALEFEYLVKRAVMDVRDKIGADSTAVLKAIKEKIERESNQ